MSTGVRETLCTKCLHVNVCGYKNNYQNMVKQLEELFYSVHEEERSAMTFHDPDCKFVEKRVPTFLNKELRTPEEVVAEVQATWERYHE